MEKCAVFCQASLLTLLALAGLAIVCRSLAAQVPAPRKIAQLNHPEEVDFQKEILPILRRNCLACHSGTKAEGELVLESPATIRKGGSQGPAVLPGKSGESLLLQLASWQKESFMPPPDNKVGAKPLTPEELGLLQLWIDQGAKGDIASGNSAIAWQPLPPKIQPIYAVAATRDGQYAAASRANRIFVYHIPSARELCRLSDPALVARGLYAQGGVADLDLIQSLAFSPDGTWLASGGFRTVKLWRKRFLAPLGQVAGWEGRPQAAAASADGAMLAMATEGGEIWVFAAAGGALRQRLRGAEGPLAGLAFTADTGRLVAVTQAGQVLVWDVADGALRGRAVTGRACGAWTLLPEGQMALAGPPEAIQVYRLPEAVSDQPPELVRKLEAEGKGAIVALAAVGSTLVSGSEDGTLRRWDVASGKLVSQWSVDGGLAQLALSPDGQRLATRSRAGSAALWDVAAGKQLATLGHDLRAALQLAHATLEASLARKQVELAKKDLEDANQRKKAEEDNHKQASEALGKAEAEFKAKSEAAQKADQEKQAAEKAVAEAGKAKAKAEEAKQAADAALGRLEEALQAVKASHQAALKIEDAAAQAARMAAEKAIAELEALRKLLAPAQDAAGKAVQQAAANLMQAEKNLQALAPAHQKAQDERLAAERTLQSAQRAVQRAQEAVQKAAAAIGPLEEALRQRQTEAQAKEAEQSEATAAAKQPLPPTQWLGISPDGSQIVCLAADGRLTTWDAHRGVPLEVAAVPGRSLSADARPAETTASPMGPLVAALAGSAVVLVGAEQASLYEYTVRYELERVLGSPDEPAPWVDRVTALDFSPDGTILAAGSGEPSRSGQIALVRVADGAQVGMIPDPHSDTVTCLAFSPDGRLLASGGADRFAKVWSVSERRLVRALEGHTHHVLGVAWRADGRVLVTSGADLALKVWDARTGEQLRTVANQFAKEITAVRFLGESASVVACSGDPRVRQIDTTNGSSQRELPGASDYLYALATSRDGQTIIGGGLDSVLMVWNAQGQQVARFPPPDSTGQTAAR
jgi:WD40 repeat protein